jgi:hypothetical protein
MGTWTPIFQNVNRVSACILLALVFALTVYDDMQTFWFDDSTSTVFLVVLCLLISMIFKNNTNFPGLVMPPSCSFADVAGLSRARLLV